MGVMRRLVLHMGLPKTGTSALQTWMATNREWLRERGVDYPGRRTESASDGLIGNGAPLLRVLGPSAATEQDEAQRVLAKVLGAVRASDAETIVYSNEWLFRQHRPEYLRAFRDALAEVGVTLAATVYVRDVVGHALSSYAQQVQTRLMTLTFGEYVGSVGGDPGVFSIQHRPRLESMLDILGSESVVVRHFDSQRGGLVHDFLRTSLGLHEKADVEVGSMSNRTLTLREIEWKRYLNGCISDRRQSYQLGRAIAAVSPGDEPMLRATADDVRALRRFQGQVEWINGNFFRADELLTVEGNDPCVDVPQQPLPITDPERRLLDSMAALVVG